MALQPQPVRVSCCENDRARPENTMAEDGANVRACKSLQKDLNRFDSLPLSAQELPCPVSLEYARAFVLCNIR